MLVLRNRISRFLIVALAGLLTIPAAGIEARAANNGLISMVVPTKTPIFGRAYGDWSAAWWQWALSIPSTAHPFFETADCNTSQSDPVFFLGGNLTGGAVVRNCTLSSTKFVFFPIADFEDSLAEEAVNLTFGGADATIASMRTGAASIIDGVTSLNISLDSKSLGRPQDFRVQSIVFDVTVPTNNVFVALGEAVAAGAHAVAVDDGFYIMLKPLAKGMHTLQFGSSFVQLTYHLTVN